MRTRRRAILTLFFATLLPAWQAAAEVGDRVRWEDGHEAEIFPGSDAFVQHLGQS